MKLMTLAHPPNPNPTTIVHTTTNVFSKYIAVQLPTHLGGFSTAFCKSHPSLNIFKGNSILQYKLSALIHACKCHVLINILPLCTRTHSIMPSYSHVSLAFYLHTYLCTLHMYMFITYRCLTHTCIFTSCSHAHIDIRCRLMWTYNCLDALMLKLHQMTRFTTTHTHTHTCLIRLK